jgi:hypothetical protein
MRFTTHLCMPEGDGSRESYEDALEFLKRDNRRVIAAMLGAGQDVADTVGQLALVYIPEQPRLDGSGRPLMDLYGLHDMVTRGSFSCGDAVGYEAAVLEEKYGVPTRCVSCPQDDNYFHAVYVTNEGAVDPTANFLTGVTPQVPRTSNPVTPMACEIGPDGRVVCDQPSSCCVDEHGVWSCPAIPGLTGRREAIGPIQRSPHGQAWTRTRNGAVVPVCVGGRPRQSLFSRLFGGRR